MNPRLIKEFRPLLLPWSVAALSAAGYLVKLGDPVFAKGEFGGFLQGLGVFAFGLGCLLLAVLPFGLELQHRTMHLLLGQPIERSRLWLEKLFVSAVTVLALGAIHFVALYAAAQGDLTLRPLPLCATLVAATICSGAVGTLTVRSIIGGMVATAGSLFGIVLLVTYVCYKVLGREVEPDEWPLTLVFVGVGAAYSALALWLGWRTFAKLELRDTLASRGLVLPTWITARSGWIKLARCQPTGQLRNLIRKEVGLQNPIFLIGLVFSACWFVALVIFALQPERQELFQGVFGALTGFYVPVIVLLSACISLAEEKTLGVAAWHLTLPVSARGQWLVKLLVAAITAVLVGLVLPFGFAWITLVKARVGLVALPPDAFWPITSVVTVVFVLGVWCASLWENTLRSAVATILSIIGLGTCANLGGWLALQFDGMQKNFIGRILAHYQLPLDVFIPDPKLVIISAALVIVPVLLVALVQSLIQFRRAQTQSKVLLKYAAILVSLTFAGSFWCVDLVISVERQSWQLNLKLREALAALPPKKEVIEPSGARVVTFRELEQTGKLDDLTKAWLNNSQITLFSPIDSPNRQARSLPPSGFQVCLLFPNGKQYWFNWR